MNIIEAFKSGKRVKLKSWDDWWWPEDLTSKYGLYPLMITSDDWEMEETQVTITRAQFDEAWAKAITKMEKSFTADLLAKELGL